MTVLENLFGTKESAFASNRNGRIVDWNKSAERLLGHSSSDVIGRQCFEVLDGKDIFGNRFCHERCAIRSMIRRHESLNHWQLNYRTASSERINVSVSAVVVNGNKPSDYVVVHVLNPLANLDRESMLGIPDKHGNRFLLDEPAEEGSCPMELTARETEVLRLLVAGSTTQKIVCRLCISEETVRTHIRNILNKLDVHSRLEAVCLAIRRRLF
jgi:PAS domain S-box-containing protein